MTRRLAALAALAVALVGPAAALRAQAPLGGPVLVLPFENARHDAATAWLGEGAAVLITERIAASGAIAIEREDRLLAFERLQLPPAAALSRASAIRVAQHLGAATLVTGRFAVSGSELTVEARIVRLDRGRLFPAIEARGSPRDLFGVFVSLAASMGVTSVADAAWRDRVPPNAAVFERFIRGLTAESATDAAALLEEVIRAAPTFDAARLALWQIQADAGDHQRALDAVASMGSDGLHAREGRFRAALSQMAMGRLEAAAETLRALQAERPAAAAANAMGVAELRRTPALIPGRATYYFSQAKDLDPADGDLFFNLGYAYWLERDAPAAAYWLREAVRRNPADGDAHFVLAAALALNGAPAEAARERELATRLSSTYEAWVARTPPGAEAVPRGLERLGRRLTPTLAGTDALAATAGQREQEALARFHLDAARRAVERDARREAGVELRRALFLSPYLAEAHLLLGRVLLGDERHEEAIQAFKIALWSEETAAAHAALADAYLRIDDRAAARDEVQRALALDPASADALAVKARLGGSP